MTEINETVSLIEKAILKERKSRKGGRSREEGDAAAPQKIDERITLIVLKLRRKNCTVREIAAHTGLGVGTVHSIIKRYGNDPQMQNLVTGGTQMELTDYLLIRPADND
jgi:DNA invertase Pin-like site-specific DNA recombinase